MSDNNNSGVNRSEENRPIPDTIDIPESPAQNTHSSISTHEMDVVSPETPVRTASGSSLLYSFFGALIYIIPLIIVAVVIWILTHNMVRISGIDTKTPKSLSEFEKIGFTYNPEQSEFDCSWPEELGALLDHIGMVMDGPEESGLCFSDDFTRLVYLLPRSASGVNMGVITISNGKEEKTIDLGNGYVIPATACKNAYIIAQMIADNPYNPFLRCFPKDVAKAIEDSNATVILLHGPASETGEFDNTGHVYWGFNIESNEYSFYNAEHDRGRKKVVLGYYTGTDAEAGLIGTQAEYVFGEKACSDASELPGLYSDLFDKSSGKGNKFIPVRMQIKFNKETKEALLKVLPYINM
jgi:hypothetical protein